MATLCASGASGTVDVLAALSALVTVSALAALGAVATVGASGASAAVPVPVPVAVPAAVAVPVGAGGAPGGDVVSWWPGAGCVVASPSGTRVAIGVGSTGGARTGPSRSVNVAPFH
ncbi:hypothetical protein MHY85_17370, partial [Cellulomonas sp. ACRRI]|uniref:hypothetical protein n=1 Tax=Cellulomonas sp. ACRRI TaxID=2918188 RepID=UPI001EF1903D